ncbi:MAG: hypothetical protein WAM85_09935 [Terracidiphilus sp.]
MSRLRILSSLALAAVLVANAQTSPAQQSLYEQFRSHNAGMTAVQPSWMGPLIQSDARLSQSLRLSVANASAPGAQIVSYGNNHGISVIAARRFQFDFDPPSFFRNHSAALKDGFGNAASQVKYLIAAGNAEHGNFALSAIVFQGFAPRSYENGMITGYYCPKLASGIAFGRFNVQSTLGGFLPTGKIAAQGRAIEWNITAQVHPTAHAWLDVENNATFNIGGPNDGKIQNFITPAAFYAVKRKGWEPAHSVVVFDAGMQIATSQFHLYNHNLISEMRILF